MAIDRQYIEQGWLDGAIHKLDALYKESREYEDEGDILPTEQEVKSAKALVSKLTAAPVPSIALTVNGEFLFMWEIAGDDFTACVSTDGSTKFHKSHVPIDQRMFINYLSNAAAA
jgi:hypothetical protein